MMHRFYAHPNAYWRLQDEARVIDDRGGGAHERGRGLQQCTESNVARDQLIR